MNFLTQLVIKCLPIGNEMAQRLEFVKYLAKTDTKASNTLIEAILPVLVWELRLSPIVERITALGTLIFVGYLIIRIFDMVS